MSRRDPRRRRRRRNRQRVYDDSIEDDTASFLSLPSWEDTQSYQQMVRLKKYFGGSKESSKKDHRRRRRKRRDDRSNRRYRTDEYYPRKEAYAVANARHGAYVGHLQPAYLVTSGALGGVGNGDMRNTVVGLDQNAINSELRALTAKVSELCDNISQKEVVSADRTAESDSNSERTGVTPMKIAGNVRHDDTREAKKKDATPSSMTTTAAAMFEHEDDSVRDSRDAIRTESGGEVTGEIGAENLQEAKAQHDECTPGIDLVSINAVATSTTTATTPRRPISSGDLSTLPRMEEPFRSPPRTVGDSFQSHEMSRQSVLCDDIEVMVSRSTDLLHALRTELGGLSRAIESQQTQLSVAGVGSEAAEKTLVSLANGTASGLEKEIRRIVASLCAKNERTIVSAIESLKRSGGREAGSRDGLKMHLKLASESEGVLNACVALVRNFQKQRETERHCWKASLTRLQASTSEAKRGIESKCDRHRETALRAEKNLAETEACKVALEEELRTLRATSSSAALEADAREKKATEAFFEKEQSLQKELVGLRERNRKISKRLVEVERVAATQKMELEAATRALESAREQMKSLLKDKEKLQKENARLDASIQSVKEEYTKEKEQTQVVLNNVKVWNEKLREENDALQRDAAEIKRRDAERVQAMRKAQHEALQKIGTKARELAVSQAKYTEQLRREHECQIVQLRRDLSAARLMSSSSREKRTRALSEDSKKKSFASDISTADTSFLSSRDGNMKSTPFDRSPVERANKYFDVDTFAPESGNVSRRLGFGMPGNDLVDNDEMTHFKGYVAIDPVGFDLNRTTADGTAAEDKNVDKRSDAEENKSKIANEAIASEQASRIETIRKDDTVAAMSWLLSESSLEFVDSSEREREAAEDDAGVDLSHHGRIRTSTDSPLQNSAILQSELNDVRDDIDLLISEVEGHLRRDP